MSTVFAASPGLPSSSPGVSGFAKAGLPNSGRAGGGFGGSAARTSGTHTASTTSASRRCWMDMKNPRAYSASM